MAGSSTKKLTPKQQRFVEEYLTDLNGARAAIRAGYSPMTAVVIASQNLSKVNVAEAIAEAKAKRSDVTNINSEWVLSRLGEMFQADIAEIIDQYTGAYKPVHDWPVVWRKMLNGMDVREMFGDDGKTGEVVKIRFMDRLKALEMIGKHINVQAFSEKHEVTGPIQLIFRAEDAKL